MVSKTTLVNGRKGLTLVLAPKARVELAHTINKGLKAHPLGEVAHASTLSPETVITRSHDTGRSASGERMSLWSFVGLCDGLDLDPHALGAQLGIELQDEEIRRGRDALDLRRLRIHREQPSNINSPELPGRFADVLTANVAMRLEPRIAELVEQKLIELLAMV